MPGQGTHANPPWENQNAIDIGAPRGTPVVAPFDGTIGPSFGWAGLGGNRLHIAGTRGNPPDSYYAHLDRFHPAMAPGRRVSKGQVVGYVGDTGSAQGTTPHLHFAVIPPFNTLHYQNAVLKCPAPRPNLPE